MTESKHISISGQTDERLMELSAAGNQKAFEMLFDRYNRQLIRFAYRYFHEVQQCEDIVQEVFMKVIERPELFQKGKRFAPWIYTMTANACKNAVRNQSNRKRILDQDIKHETMTEMKAGLMHDNAVIRNRIREALGEMNDREQQMFVLRFEHELTMSDIGEILSIPEGTVKSGIYYMLKKMALKLKDLKS